MRKPFPFYKQADSVDCGPASLRMIAAFYGKKFTQQYLREISYIDNQGVNLKGISVAAENIGFRTLPVKVTFDQEKANLLKAPLPAIAHWNQNHFLVVYKVTKTNVWLADPASGKHKLPRQEFSRGWLSDGEKGILLLFEPAPKFYEEPVHEDVKFGFSYLLSYLRPYKKWFFQLFLGLLLGSLFQLIFPFLTQALVDIGIQNQNIQFVYLVLIAQLVLFFSQTMVQFIQSWILLHVSTRINVSLIADFLIKLMRLPIGFFDTKNIGDLMQRIGDHQRIEAFLTQSSLQVLFSSINLIVFGVVLAIYNLYIFLIFIFASFLYIIWILIFLKERKKIDYLAFRHRSDNNDSIIEIIQGMTEIKLQGSEQKRRWGWTHIQAKLFRANIKSLAIGQYQEAGALFISQAKDIFISFLVAKSVIDGEMTLGMMLAVQYIIGQVNAPLLQIINFIRTAQDASISLERLGEIHNRPEEIDNNQILSGDIKHDDILINDLSFQYTPISDYVLQDVTVTIPRNKITAIVGMSGSGKTTLIKLLLGFYKPTKGTVDIGKINISTFHPSLWRNSCGVVMQDGYIFSDSIANNIAESEETQNKSKLQDSVRIANIEDFINSLPLRYNTMIGAKGKGISQGQRQRILIARAVYKDPQYLFFDEATNALDANNEKIIMENLNHFFKGRTVVIVAHRLSTVKNADQIIVLDKGRVVETGNHSSLVEKRGAYFTLVKNQLELGT